MKSHATEIWKKKKIYILLLENLKRRYFSKSVLEYLRSLDSFSVLSSYASFTSPPLLRLFLLPTASVSPFLSASLPRFTQLLVVMLWFLFASLHFKMLTVLTLVPAFYYIFPLDASHFLFFYYRDTASFFYFPSLPRVWPYRAPLLYPCLVWLFPWLSLSPTHLFIVRTLHHSSFSLSRFYLFLPTHPITFPPKSLISLCFSPRRSPYCLFYYRVSIYFFCKASNSSIL